jgi:SnoaL-like protein
MDSSKAASETTWGRRFFDEQIALLQEMKTDELIERHYHSDAVLVSFQGVVRGQEALKHHFRKYMKKLGQLSVLSLDQFVETEDGIFLEASVVTALGKAQVYDAFVVRDGRISHHFTGIK